MRNIFKENKSGREKILFHCTVYLRDKMRKRARATPSLSYLNINLNNHELPRALLVNIKTVPKAFIKGDVSGSRTLYTFPRMGIPHDSASCSPLVRNLFVLVGEGNVSESTKTKCSRKEFLLIHH